MLLTCAAQAQDTAARERLARILGEDATPLVAEAPPGNTIPERLFIDVGLSARQALFHVNNPDSTSTRLWQTQAKLYGHLSYAGAHEAYLRLNFDYRDYGEGDVLSDAQGDGQLATPILDEAWYRFDLSAARRLEGAPAPDVNVRLTVGRQRAIVGSGLVFDDELDAVAADLSTSSFSLSLLAGLTPKSSTVDFDGSRPDFDTSTRRRFFSAQARWSAHPAFQPYAFLLTQIDDNDTRRAVLDVGGTAVPTDFRYDSTYLSLGASGALDERWVWSVEGVYEWGRSRSNPFDYATGAIEPQTTDDIRAWAAIASVNYLFNDERSSKVHLWLMAGSGDEDRRSGNQTLGGNALDTTDRAFNAFGYLPTGYVLAPDLANLFVARLGASTRLGDDNAWRVGTDAYLYTKLDEEGGATVETLRGERFVGGAIDVFATWRFAPRATLDVRYGLFVPGEAIPDEHDDLHHLIYVGVGYAF